jgi:hypothetical protein
MITTNTKIKVLKDTFENSSVPLADKVDIIDFFKQYNDWFYGNYDIELFFKQLNDLSSKWIND